MYKTMKQQVRDLLYQKDYDQLVELCEKNRKVWTELRFRLYDMDEKIRCSAIEAVAQFMKYLWRKGRIEKVREYMRNLFWSLNDESGGIGWSSPQTIAEMIVNIPELLDPFGSMMVAHTLDEPPLVKGGLWGIGRLGMRAAESVEFFKDLVLRVFENDDSETLSLASWALGEVRFRPALPFLEKLKDRKETGQIYIDGEFHEKQLGQWAKEAIEKINKDSRGQGV
jgi:hypothetical protein